MPSKHPMPAHGIAHIEPALLEPDFWLAQLRQPHQVIMDANAIAAYNARVTLLDPHIHDLRKLPARLQRETLRAWIAARSRLAHRRLYDQHGHAIPESTQREFADTLALDAIPTQVRIRYGLAVQRVALRTFPTAQRVFSRRGDTDIDRFQECAIVPGTPVAVLHTSRDGEWYFVETPLYRAWVQREHVAIGAADRVFEYVDEAPFLVVTGASVRTVFTPELPAVSGLQLDMGTRIPFDPDWQGDKPVNGQGPGSSFVIELPMRTNSGLGFARALLQRNADVQRGHLALTRANIIRQAFKFLGERYGWGGAFDSRDCSGFVSDVYRSMGVVMPRNTAAQSTCPAADIVAFDRSSSHAMRRRAVRDLEAGDLVYTPDHVMMMIGHARGQPWVIHDVHDVAWLASNGKLRHLKLNAVSVTPLLPLMYDRDQSVVERMTAIVRFRPTQA